MGGENAPRKGAESKGDSRRPIPLSRAGGVAWAGFSAVRSAACARLVRSAGIRAAAAGAQVSRAGSAGPAGKAPGPLSAGPAAVSRGLRHAEHKPGQQGERQDMAPQTIPGHSGRVKAAAGGARCGGGWPPARGGSAALARRLRGCWGGSREGVRGAGWRFGSWL